ncbi:MAG: prephenate dehydrogenase/arogenate dehydrogenase family protein [Acidimicrobiia bacterium]|nr:prephenate dehydrogenase/arogenate dehydrogenase family protein [Acidimicrobiia bacterium]MDX2466500.1 prephenate dehydrogenase/arogenate dehydrogenase family protein [Acidimicrobiia bacterium]
MSAVAISGTGLIGASIGLGLARAGWTVIGWDPDAAVLATAKELGAITQIAESFAALVSGDADLIVMAGPPRAVIEQVAELETDSLVIDVAGVKTAVLGAARPTRFVGTHPMAGREVTGPQGASPSLFRGATWVVVVDGAAEADLRTVEAALGQLGARPVRMTAAEHDAAIAMISHLPQVLATALVNEAADRINALDLAAGSFRDLTRVAASDPAIWVDLLDINSADVVGAIEDFRQRLGVVADALVEGDADVISAFLSRGQEIRRTMAPGAVPVRVALADEPGELARVGRALGSSSVDVRDLQLRHAPHGGGGVLTVSVRPGEAETLRTALADEGLLVLDS